MGPVWWKKCSLLILPMIKSDQLVIFCLLFQPILKVIENAFARGLGGIIQHYMGYRLGYERSRSRPYLYALATLIHSWGAAHACIDYNSSTDGEGEHQTEYNLARHCVCVVAAQLQLAALHMRNKFVNLAGMNRTRRSKNVFFC